MPKTRFSCPTCVRWFGFTIYPPAGGRTTRGQPFSRCQVANKNGTPCRHAGPHVVATVPGMGGAPAMNLAACAKHARALRAEAPLAIRMIYPEITSEV